MKKLLIVLLFIISHPSQARKIPVEDFFKQADIQSSTLSPTGEFLAAVVDKEGKFRLVVFNLKTNKVVGVTSLTNSRGINRVFWVNDIRYAFTTTYEKGSLAIPQSTGEILAANYDGSKEGVIVRDKKGIKGVSGGDNHPIKIIDPLPDNKNLSIVQQYKKDGFTKIFKLNVYTGKKKRIASPPTQNSSVIVDHDHKVRFSIGRIYSKAIKDDVIQIHYRKKDSKQWTLIETRKVEAPGMHPIAFDKNNKNIYVHLEATDKNVDGIYLYDVESQKSKLIWENKSGADIDQYIWDGDIRKPVPIGVVQSPGIPTNFFFDENHKMAKLYRNLERSFPGSFISFRNFTKDGKKALVSVYSDTDPGVLYLINLETYEMQYILSGRPWINPKEMRPMKAITYQTRDGLTIHGYLTLPKGKSKNLPMVLYVHGGPYGVRDNWGWNPIDQFLANRGYAVLKVNYRGSKGYGHPFVYENYHKEGAEMQDDLTDATLWAIKQGIADKKRICIFGASYGGYASLMGAVKEPDLYQCAIPYVGVYDIKLIHTRGTYSRSHETRKNVKKLWGSSDEFIQQRSPINFLDKLKAALFIVHGEKDEIADFSHYEALTDALDDIDYPYEYLLKKTEGHGFYLEKNNYELFTKIENFLKKHIGN